MLEVCGLDSKEEGDDDGKEEEDNDDDGHNWQIPKPGKRMQWLSH